MPRVVDRLHERKSPGLREIRCDACVRVVAAHPARRAMVAVEMKIGILGSGLMGAKLGAIWARAGHEVAFSYSRDPRKLEQLANDAGTRARAATPRDAVADADAVLVAVNWPQLDDVLAQAGDLAGKVVVTCALPMVNEQLAHAHTWSGAEELAQRLATSHVVAAFGTVPSECLFGVYEARDSSPRPSLIYYGDDAAAKHVATQLIADAGFDPIDLGPLRTARYAEPFTLLVGQLAYDGPNGPAVAYRFEWLEQRR
jgi:predicted dinucleotide-binding enzyme